MLQIIPRAERATIEKILDVLPEPSEVQVHLFGDVVEFKKLRTDIDVQLNESPKVRIKEPTKDKIRKLLHKEGDHSLPRMDFSEASFSLKELSPNGRDPIRVRLTAYGLEITYYSWKDTSDIFDMLDGIDTSQLEVTIKKERDTVGWEFRI